MASTINPDSGELIVVGTVEVADPTAGEHATNRNYTGDLASLNTVDKTNLVAAVNETLSSVDVSQLYNPIVNPNFEIDQEFVNAGTPRLLDVNNEYVADGWRYNLDAASANVLEFNTESAITVDNGRSQTSGKFGVNNSDVPSGDEYFAVSSFIEGFTWAFLHEQATKTISFRTRATNGAAAGVYTIVFKNFDGTRRYVSEFTVTDTSGAVWETQSITIPADASGTWKFDNDIGLQISIVFGSGANRKLASTGGTLNTWEAGTAFGGDEDGLEVSDNQVNFAGNASNALEITQFKVNPGSSPVGFFGKTFEEDLALAQRYYEKSWKLDTAPGTATDVGYVRVLQHSSDAQGLRSNAFFAVAKREGYTPFFYAPFDGVVDTVELEPSSSRAVNTSFEANAGPSSVPLETSGTATGTNVWTFHWVADGRF